MPGPDEVALVFAADEPYVLGLAVAMHSALMHLDEAVRPKVCVLEHDLSRSSRERLGEVVRTARAIDEVHWIPVREEPLPHAKSDSHFSTATYARLLTTELLAPTISRAVYLDADLLVRRDISPLFARDLGGALVGAVRDFNIPTADHPGSGVRDPAHPRSYFNTGVLVMDLAGWKREGLAERALRYAAAGKPLRYADQDALNAVVEDWHELEAAWNVQVTGRSLLSRRLRAPTKAETRHMRAATRAFHSDILHFIGTHKPWQRGCTTPGTVLWERAALRTGWFRRQEALTWLLSMHGTRMRYRLGNARRQRRGHVGQGCP